MNNPKQTVDTYIKGRGAQINPANPFHNNHSETDGQIWHDEDEMEDFRQTQHIETHPKTILNKVESPDLGFEYSMNPYQGCEHGCIYCYARNTHTYWGYSSGIEFEQKILIKKTAPALLEQKIKSKNWKPYPIMFSGNTDCYQPAEKKYQLTKQMLEILWKYKHPVSIITKSALILRDLDLLTEMSKLHLLKVAISITSLDESLRLRLEPRAASGKKRIQIVRKLSDVGIPVHLMMAPIIPSINDTEIPAMAKAAAEAGARNISHTIVRLNGDIGEIFKDWLIKNYPDRYDRVLHQIQSCHGGRLNDSKIGRRMRGDGKIADIISQQVKLAKAKYFKGRSSPQYDTTHYENLMNPQMKLF